MGHYQKIAKTSNNQKKLMKNQRRKKHKKKKQKNRPFFLFFCSLRIPCLSCLCPCLLYSVFFWHVACKCLARVGRRALRCYQRKPYIKEGRVVWSTTCTVHATCVLILLLLLKQIVCVFGLSFLIRIKTLVPSHEESGNTSLLHEGTWCVSECHIVCM